MFRCISNDWIAKDYCSGSPRLWETELFGSILTIIQKEAAVVMDKKALMQKADSKLAERMSGIDRQLYELRQRISIYDNDHIEIVFCFRNAFEQLEGVIADE